MISQSRPPIIDKIYGKKQPVINLFTMGMEKSPTKRKTSAFEEVANQGVAKNTEVKYSLNEDGSQQKVNKNVCVMDVISDIDSNDST